MVEQMSEDGQEGSIIAKIKGLFGGAKGLARDVAKDAKDASRVNEALKSSESLGVYGGSSQPNVKMEEKTKDREPVANR